MINLNKKKKTFVFPSNISSKLIGIKSIGARKIEQRYVWINNDNTLNIDITKEIHVRTFKVNVEKLDE